MPTTYLVTQKMMTSSNSGPGVSDAPTELMTYTYCSSECRAQAWFWCSSKGVMRDEYHYEFFEKCENNKCGKIIPTSSEWTPPLGVFRRLAKKDG